MKQENKALLKAEELSKHNNEKSFNKKEIDSELNTAKNKIHEKQVAKHQGTKKFKVAIAVLSLGIISLTAGLLCSIFIPREKEMMLDASYRRSFYDAVEQVDNIDLNLSKALATNDKVALSGYLFNTAIESELAENDIHYLHF